MKNFLSKIQFRTVVQLSIVIIVITLALFHQIYWIEKAASIDTYCPFWAVEGFFTLIFKWEFLKRIFTSTFILLWTFFIASIFLGRIFCWYFCPLWALQEWIRKLWKKLWFKKDYEINEKFDKYLRYLKYIILVVIIYYSFYLNDLIFRHYDPYTSLLHFWREFNEKIIWYIILIVILIMSLFTKSFWCRYACPLGAFYWIQKKLSFFKIKRNKKSCNSCWLCNRNCPANLKIKEKITTKDADCISCWKCIKNCPKNSLSYVICKKKTSSKNFTLLVIAIVILPLIVAPLTPYWKTKPESNIINTKWEINTGDIRWSNTLKYIIEVTKVPFSEFKEKLNLPDDVNKTMKLKLIWSKYDIKNADWHLLETNDFRMVIDKYFK